MKVGILTFSEEDNYGAVLQAYALQTVLERRGVNPEFVRIEKKQSSGLSTAPMSPFARMLETGNMKRHSFFESFREKNLKRSRMYLMTDNIDGEYDFFLAGSDQIWNFTLPATDAGYLLPFASPNKRCSYAASFGTDEISEKLENKLAEALKTFHGLSVREESGRNIIRRLTGKEAALCLDPTLLLSPEDFAKAEQAQTGEYVFLYMVNYDKDLLEEATAYATDHNMKLITTTASFMPQVGIGAWNETGVEQWIGRIHGAECVFTNSFHAIVLSLLFEKKMSVHLLNGNLQTRSGRIYELLSLTDALCSLSEPVETKWEQSALRIAKRKTDSLDYLEDLIRFYNNGK